MFTLAGKGAFSTSIEGFPYIKDSANSQVDSNSTSHTVALPSDVASGDLLLIVFNYRNYTVPGVTLTTPSGWVLVDSSVTDNENSVSLYVFARIASGSEGSTVSVTSSANARSAHCSICIAGHDAAVSPSVSGILVSKALNDEFPYGLPNPPSLTASWGSDKNLWVAVCGISLGGRTYTAAPGDYAKTEFATNTSSLASRCSTAVAHRYLLSDSDDPSTFNLGAEDYWKTMSLVIKPEAI
jgi:hypothetical protein